MGQNGGQQSAALQKTLVEKRSRRRLEGFVLFFTAWAVTKAETHGVRAGRAWLQQQPQ